MANPQWYNRRRQTTTTTGTGSLTLGSTSSTYKNLNDTGADILVTYCVVHRTADEWETGWGIVNSTSTTLSNRIITDSSTGGTVSFSAGTKDVFLALIDDFVPRADPGRCDGRLTLTSGTPVTTADVTGATTVYFTPCIGNQITLNIGDGTNHLWQTFDFTELSLALGTVTSGLPYDVFIYANGTTLTLEKLAWTNATSRATGLSWVDGVLLKTGGTTRRYLGTFYTTSTTQTEDSITKRFLWNYYNQAPRDMLIQDATATWNYTTNTLRQARATSSNRVEYVQGWSNRPIEAEVFASASNSVGAVTLRVGVGIDSTSAGSDQEHLGRANGTSTNAPIWCRYRGYPGVGYHALNWLEASEATGTTTWIGTAGSAPAELISSLRARVWG